MIHLDFILWMILFPISISIGSYIDEKRYKLKGEKYVIDSETKLKKAILYTFLWIFIGYQLF